MATYTRKAIRGSATVFLMSGIASVIAYLTRMVLARNLSTTNYGLFYAVFSFVTFFLFFRGFGLDSALVKYVSEFRAKKQNNKIKSAFISTLSMQFITSTILIIVFFFLADFLAETYFKNPLASMILRILCIYVFFSVFFRVIKDMFLGFQKLTIFSISEPLKNLLSLLLIFLFIRMGFNVFAPVWAYALTSILLTIILFPFLINTFNFFRYKISDLKGVSKKLIFFGVPVVLTGVGGTMIGNMDTLILTYFRPLSEVGIYNVVLPSALLFLVFGGSIATVLFPMISELYAKKDKKRISEGLRLIYRYSFATTIPILLSVFVFSEIFIRLLFGEKYVSGALAFQILLIGALFFILAGINNTSISAMGKPQVVTRIILIAALFNLVLNFILIPKYSINGAALATTMSYLIILILSTKQVVKEVKLEVPIWNWIKTFFAGLIFVSVIYFIKSLLFINQWLELVISISIASLVYLFLIYVLKVIDVKELKKYFLLVK